MVLETNEAGILESGFSSIRFAQNLAQAWEMEYDLLAIGGLEISSQATRWLSLGAKTLWTISQPELIHLTADTAAHLISVAMREAGATTLVCVSSTFGKDVLPRLAEMHSLPMVSDVIAVGSHESGLQFVRPMFAGNILATVEIASRSAVFSVRSSAFRDPKSSSISTALRPLPVDTANLPSGAEWVSLSKAALQRPELTSARCVVSGGRPLRDSETFERVIGGLADALHGAVGATRAAVDSGIAPNELQVGQTGKVVAPELYIAAGISGSIQHLAGMKDSRVIVAINTDSAAPIFEVADYGLVADLFDALPEMTEAVRAPTSN